jgi:hypothetical protein
MTMSGFRSAPRKGHLERAKRIVCYLYRFKSAQLRYRTHEPDLSDVVQPDYDWADSIYGKIREEIPRDILRPLGKPVVTEFVTLFEHREISHWHITFPQWNSGRLVFKEDE